GTVNVIRYGRGDISRLPLKPGFEQPLIHPDLVRIVFRITVFSKLPVYPPSGIRAVYEVYQPFGFPCMVPVVVYADQIGEFVKHKLMGVAKSPGKDLKITSVRVTTYNDALVGILPFFSIRTLSVKSQVADCPIDPPCGTHGQSGYIMPAKSYVNAIPMGY